MQLGQLSALITVDGEPLSEHAIEYSADGMEATCWIASENGKNFCIKFEDTDASPHRTLSARVRLDGMKCGGLLMGPSRLGSRVTTAKRDSVSTSANTRRPLAFSKQVLTDDDTYLNATISPDFGTIKVLFALVKLRGTSGNPEFVSCEPTILHERSKKAIGHSVQFGPEFHTRKHSVKWHSQDIKTLATFSFKYRPIELLRAQGIAPPGVREERAATPTDILDLTMDVDDEDTDEAKIKELEIQLQALKKKKKKQVKREPSDVKKEIKSERLAFIPGEVIDLT
ncbi:hypothetical protein B0H19DRAFT_1375061 [Mycena capillaripes]|nr:hypothetical protein B0H19DRAFT_1375061 [Mycena capillaripes]